MKERERNLGEYIHSCLLRLTPIALLQPDGYARLKKDKRHAISDIDAFESVWAQMKVERGYIPGESEFERSSAAFMIEYLGRYSVKRERRELTLILYF